MRTPTSTLVLGVVLGVVLGGCTVPGRTDGADGVDADDSFADEPGQIALDIVGRAAEPVILDAATDRPSSFPPGPADVPTGPLPAQVRADLDEVLRTFGTYVDLDVVRRLAATEDPRVLWPLAEVLRFTQTRPEGTIILEGVAARTGVVLEARTGVWAELTDHLLAWDLPTPPGHLAFKVSLLTQLEPGWSALFDDAGASVDWRQVAWAGVRLDDRPSGATGDCEVSCTPALDRPQVTDADGGSWYEDDRTVIAVVVGGEARAYPLHLLEAHELVNDEVGGRAIAVAYTTVCGAAQAYVTDDVAGADGSPLVLRTSGLLHGPSTLLMDLATRSTFDAGDGRAVAGPLRTAGAQLEPITTLRTTWGAWRRAHPDTTILAEDPGTGRGYSLDPYAGQDLDVPPVPVGDVDPRLGLRAAVVGVVLDDGSRVAFDVEAATATLAAGGGVAVGDVRLVDDGGGLRAVRELRSDVAELPATSTCWFAWSGRHPTTRLWTTGG